MSVKGKIVTDMIRFFTSQKMLVNQRFRTEHFAKIWSSRHGTVRTST